jgi:hypothetical protein
MTREEFGRFEQGLKIVREFGFPTLVLCVVGWWVHMAAISIHSTVVLPVIKSHTDFMEVTQETLQGLGETQERQAETLPEISNSQREIVEAVTKMQPCIGAAPKGN